MSLYENMTARVSDSDAPGIREAADRFDVRLARLVRDTRTPYDPQAVAEVEREAQVTFSAWAMAAAIGADTTAFSERIEKLTAQVPLPGRPVVVFTRGRVTEFDRRQAREMYAGPNRFELDALAQKIAADRLAAEDAEVEDLRAGLAERLDQARTAVKITPQSTPPAGPARSA